MEARPSPFGWDDSVGIGEGMLVTALGVTSLGVLSQDLAVSGRVSSSRGVPLTVQPLCGALRPSSASGFSDAPRVLFSRQPSRKLPGGAVSALARGLPPPRSSVQKARVTHKVLLEGWQDSSLLIWRAQGGTEQLAVLLVPCFSR